MQYNKKINTNKNLKRWNKERKNNMDKVYIKTKDLDFYDYVRIENIKYDLGLELKDIISLEDLLRILECLYNEYSRLLEEKEDENNNC